MLLESIRVKNGRLPLLALHQRRMDRARRAHFPKSPVIKLAKMIPELEIPDRGLFKLRIEYADRVLMTELVSYEVRPINSLQLVAAPGVKYTHKYSDRSTIQEAYQRRGTHDDVLMTQDGYLMDTSYGNVALYDGRHWYTPSYPMLRGVRREKLLAEKRIRPAIIRERDLGSFQSLRLMNAMLPWQDMPVIPITNIAR